MENSKRKPRSAEYVAWLNMKARCYRPSAYNFSRYGGRGIKVCDRWLNSSENFLVDMGLKPGLDYSLDRINNNGDYEPGNCRWATRKEQARNRSYGCRLVKLDGQERTVTEWAELTGINRAIAYNRMTKGWSEALALKTPPIKSAGRPRFISYLGRTQSISEWAEEYNIARSTLSSRLGRGWSMERALGLCDRPPG